MYHISPPEVLQVYNLQEYQNCTEPFLGLLLMCCELSTSYIWGGYYWGIVQAITRNSLINLDCILTLVICKKNLYWLEDVTVVLKARTLSSIRNSTFPDRTEEKLVSGDTGQWTVRQNCSTCNNFSLPRLKLDFLSYQELFFQEQLQSTLNFSSTSLEFGIECIKELDHGWNNLFTGAHKGLSAPAALRSDVRGSSECKI